MKMIDKSKLVDNILNDWVYEIVDDYSSRYEVYYGGGGSGKSYGAMTKVILKACCNVRTVLVVRKVKTTILNSVYSLTIEILKRALPSFSITYREVKSDFTIHLSNGSKFIFQGLDDPEKIKSINGITDIVIEEATELTFDDFTQLDIRLRPKEKFPQIFLMFNPVSKSNWCYKHWFEDDMPSTLVIKTTYKDNKFISSQYKNTLENLIKTNRNYYKVYCLGEFVTLDKLVFDNFEVVDINERDVEKLKCFVGLDFGYVNDPTAIIKFRYSSDAIYIVDEFVRVGMLNSDIYTQAVKNGFSKYNIIADCAERKSIDELRKMGLCIKPCKKGKGSIINDIDFILSHKIYINSSCVNTIEEFQNYTWAKSNGGYTNKPIDKHNHLIDALRYGLQNRNNSNISIAKLIKEYK